MVGILSWMLVALIGQAHSPASPPASTPSNSPFRPDSVIVFAHVTLIDGTGAPPIRDAAVVVTGNRIQAIGRAGEIAVPPGARIVDGTGKFLIPGLWDMHVHTSWDRHFTMPLLIANGVTGVREMFGKDVAAILRIRRRITDGEIMGPRIVTAGRIVDGANAAWPGSLIARTDEEGRRAVRETKAAGADFVKVYSSLDRPAYFAVADEARKLGIPFAGHVPNAVSAAEASDAGQRSIEHLTGILQAAPDSTRAAALFARFRANRTWQTPTLTVLRVGADPSDSALIQSPNLRYVPYTLRGLWGVIGRMASANTSPERRELGRRTFERQLEVVGEMYRDSVPLLAGTDEPNPYTIPGFSIHDELELLVKAGLPPMAALQTATRNPALFLGGLDSLGTIEPGKLADLVLLDADPLENIANTRAISVVVVNGRFLDRSALDEILHSVVRNRWRLSAAAAILSGAILQRIPGVVFVGLGGVVVLIVVGIVALRRRRRRKKVLSS
jgi:imidazolonepropionase-like amidohydrolase